MLKNISRSSHWICRSCSTTKTTAHSQTAYTGHILAKSAIKSTCQSQGCQRRGFLTGPCTAVHFKHSSCRNMSGVDAAVTHKHTNRLIKEQSPYLLQHAHNPVDWYPWGDEAIAAARAQDKLIFLSVGYSTCHWCHVMEHESFENSAVAKIMNENFINIKVDREERPDIDQIYMHYLLRLNKSGGWPMSVWLTPDLKPVFAGTYYPPKDRWGMPSFTNVLTKIANNWQNKRADLLSIGNRSLEAIEAEFALPHSEAKFEPGSMDAMLQQALSMFKQLYNSNYGGFSLQPKFPEVPRLNLLLHAFTVTRDQDVLQMVLNTLYKIGQGGIRDHVFGGFARYSVDREWHVPHFEKMLYDQGQLMAAYASAYKLSKMPYYLECAETIYRYVMKDLRHPLGGFYAAEDADSFPTADATEKVEGAYYAWEYDEIEAIIAGNLKQYPTGYDAEKLMQIYAYFYDIRRSGNVAPASDPHGHLLNKNILIRRVPCQETCDKFGLEQPHLQQILALTNELLHKEREKRPRPHLDTKIICSWNGLMLSGLSKLANCSNNEQHQQYLDAAKQLVEFLKQHLYVKEQKRLLRSRYGVDCQSSELLQLDQAPIYGFLDDYAFVIKGLLDYYKASLDIGALNWARELQEVQDELFWDNEKGAYFFSQADASHLIMRLKSDHEGAEPCGNSIAANNLILLSHYFDIEDQRTRAKKVLDYFAPDIGFGYQLPQMMCALMLYERGVDLIAVVGTDEKETEHFLNLCRPYYIPRMIIMRIDPKYPERSCSDYANEKFKMLQDKTTVYICLNKVCQIPMHEPSKLISYLKENYSLEQSGFKFMEGE